MSAKILPKVVILCGGQGKRLRPLTQKLPKPLIKLHDKPVLEHIIEFYWKRGFKDFVLLVGFNAAAIRRFVVRLKLPVRIELSDAGEKAGILERIYRARGLFGDRAIITYGDTFIDVDIAAMLKRHLARKPLATITIADIRSPFGLVSLDRQSRIRSFDEKPLQPFYIGHMILEKTALRRLDRRTVSLPDGEGLVRFFKQLIRGKHIDAFKHAGLQITFNTMQEYRKAQTAFLQFYTQREENERP